MLKENNIKKYELKPWEELSGTLLKFKEEGDMIVLFLSSFIAIEVENVLNKEILSKALGRKIGILRTNNSFRFRVIEEK